MDKLGNEVYIRSRLAALSGLLLLTCYVSHGHAQEVADEPGLAFTAGEPERPTSALAFSLEEVPVKRVRLALAFGYSSLLVDPNVAQGMGAGLFISYEFYRRFGDHHWRPPHAEDFQAGT